MRRQTIDALLNSFYEFILITFPIGLYVSFEAIHMHDWIYLFTSPEWGIAIIFLIFIGISNYISAARRSHRSINETVIRILNLSRLIGIIISVLISFYSVMCDNKVLIVIRITFLIAVSLGFLILLTSSELMNEKE